MGSEEHKKRVKPSLLDNDEGSDDDEEIIPKATKEKEQTQILPKEPIPKIIPKEAIPKEPTPKISPQDAIPKETPDQEKVKEEPETLPPEPTPNIIPETAIAKEPTDREKKKEETPKYFIPKREAAGAPKQPTVPSKDRPATTFIAWSDSETDEEQEPGENSDPTAPPAQRHFRPKLYDFVLEDYDQVRQILIENEQKFDNNCIIRCPEFATLLDHVIATVWYFYRDWKMWHSFNVPQLEWTIKFLDGLLNCEHFEHVEIIKRQLENLLFILYTEVPDYSIVTPQPQSPPQSVRNIPFSLQALLKLTPDFQKYLSIDAAPVSRRSCAHTTVSKLDSYGAARIQLMKNELDKLHLYERRRGDTRPDGDAELREIINNIKMLAEDIVTGS